jgi:hypothetical protein
MRRVLLITTFVILVLLDVALVPTALLFLSLGSVLTGVSLGASVPMAILGLVLAIIPLALTVALGKTLWGRP